MGILRERLPEDITGGSIEDIVVLKRYRNKDVLTAFPDMSKVIFSIKQLEGQKRFREAVEFAKAVCADPGQKAKYKALAKPKQKVYHAILSFVLTQVKDEPPAKEPEVYVIKASGEKYKIKKK